MTFITERELRANYPNFRGAERYTKIDYLDPYYEIECDGETEIGGIIYYCDPLQGKILHEIHSYGGNYLPEVSSIWHFPLSNYHHPFGLALPSSIGKPELETQQTWNVFKDGRRIKKDYWERVVVFEQGWSRSCGRPRYEFTIEEAYFEPYGNNQWLEVYHSVFPDLILPDSEDIFLELIYYSRNADNLMIATKKTTEWVSRLLQLGGSIPRNLGQAKIVTIPAL